MKRRTLGYLLVSPLLGSLLAFLGYLAYLGPEELVIIIISGLVGVCFVKGLIILLEEL